MIRLRQLSRLVAGRVLAPVRVVHRRPLSSVSVVNNSNDVTASNFASRLPSVLAAIDAAAFVAVDAEFSGLHVPGDGLLAMPFDTPEERYDKCRRSAASFAVLQFGLAAFQYNAEADRYSSRTFNFFVFPSGDAVTSFASTASCLAFLRRQGFDFNTLFGDGIPYSKNGGMAEEEGDFATVVRRLSASGKLVVGHNMMLDVCHALQHFLAPLPEDYGEFKALAADAFPLVADTKLMANSYPLREDVALGSSLFQLRQSITREPFSMPDVDGDGGDAAGFHQAGYDAHATGLCFIAMADRWDRLAFNSSVSNATSLLCRLGHLWATQDRSRQQDAVERTSSKHLPVPSSPLLKPFLNKLFLMESPDVPYVNLVGSDPRPARDHVFHVAVPAGTTFADLHQLFSHFGQTSAVWADEARSAAFVSLDSPRANAARRVVEALSGAAAYTITPYRWGGGYV